MQSFVGFVMLWLISDLHEPVQSDQSPDRVVGGWSRTQSFFMLPAPVAVHSGELEVTGLIPDRDIPRRFVVHLEGCAVFLSKQV